MKRIEIDDTEILLSGQYVMCSQTGSYHSALACYKHSAGEYRDDLVRAAIGERCLGCARWVDVLEEQTDAKALKVRNKAVKKQDQDKEQEKVVLKRIEF